MACDLYRMYQLQQGGNPDSGPFNINFCFLDAGPAPPNAPAAQVTYKSHAGVNGYAIYLDGVRSDPIEYVTMTDFETLEIAAIAWTGYQVARTNPVSLVWKNIAFGDFLIDDVRMIEMRRILKMVGGTVLGNAAQALLTVQWSLLRL